MRYNGKSLEEVHASVNTIDKSNFWRKLLAFVGPAYLVSVGYMDPGNWATDIAGGSQFGYALIWVLLMSNMMAILLQSLAARLGLVRGLDLAQASKEYYPGLTNYVLYGLAEVAIAACDLAEVIGMAIGLQLLFHIPLLLGVLITILDTFLLLFFINKGIRKIEAFILALIGVIGLGFLTEIIFAQPDFGALAVGFIPTISNNYALYLSIGIIGATVMPHNLYLHSALVQTRRFDNKDKGLKDAIKFNIIDSTIALNIAFLVNMAILVLAAATFYKSGMFDVTDIADAHRFLAPLLGSSVAPVIYAVALIAAGQSSTLTGTLAGQIVMEGYLNLRVQPWIRRIITRLAAIIPAVATIIFAGEAALGKLLILSQVVLSLQLGFAVVPLIHFVSDKEKMGNFSIGRSLKLISWMVTIVIIVLNAKMVYDQIDDWIAGADNPIILWLTAVPFAALTGLLLLYITFKPAMSKVLKRVYYTPHRRVESYVFTHNPSYSRIAVAIDLTAIDNDVLNYAIKIGGKDSQYRLIHIVESAGAIFMGNEIKDFETLDDAKIVEGYAGQLQLSGYNTTAEIGFGNPKKVIPGLVESFHADLLVMGSHGHRIIKDLIFGTTIESVRHSLKIPVLIVRSR